MSDRIPLYQIGESVIVLPGTNKYFHTIEMKSMVNKSYIIDAIDNSNNEEFVWYKLDDEWFPEFELTSNIEIQEITSEEVTDILENG